MANYLSFSRIFLIAPILFFLFLDYKNLAFILFVIASITDYLDGYVARKYNQSTAFGSSLDLLADKLLIVSLLIWFVYYFSSIYIFIGSLMIILREISISILRIFYSNRSNKEVVNVDKFGKFKTTFQMISVSFLIVISEKNSFFYFLEILLIFTSVLSIASLLNYLLKWKSNSGE